MKLSDRLTSHWAYRAIRWTLGIVFFYAGGSKLMDPQAFAVLIEAYGLVPEALLMPLAVFLPALEVVAAIGLLLDLRGALAAVTALLMIFMAILAYGIRMGLDVDCGCFVPEDPEARAFHGLRPAIYRDLLMMAGALFLYWWRSSRSLKPKSLSFVFQKLKPKEIQRCTGTGP
jgi:uncharacterized membrane protein YphA (DoxX/SURF4 family)